MENGLSHENKQINGNHVEELKNGSIPNGVTNFDPPPAKKNKLTPKKVVTIVDSDDDDDLPLAKLKIASPKKSDKNDKNGSDKENMGGKKEGGGASDSDDDTPLSKITVKKPVKKVRKLIVTGKIKTSQKQATLFDMMKKGKMKMVDKSEFKTKIGLNDKTDAKSDSKSDSKLKSEKSKSSSPKKPRESPQSSKAAKILKKYEKMVAQKKDEIVLRQLKVQYNKLIRQMAKDFHADKMEKITNEQVKNDVLAKKEKNRIDALTPEQRKEFFC